jgi:hypothetical protein
MRISRLLTGAICLLGATISYAQGSPAKQYSELRDKGFEAQGKGKNEEARKYFKGALDINADDGQVWVAYAQTASRSGEPDEALKAIQKVLELGSFGAKVTAVAYFEAACIYARKEDSKNAWKNLDLAMSSGFRSLSQLQKEPRLELLHKDSKWEEVTATKDVSKMSRTEGWKYDLWLLDRELRRIHFAPYKYVNEKDRAAMIRKIVAGISNWSDEKILVEMMRYVASFGDGHTRLSFPKILRPRLQFFHFDEGIYVTAGHSDHRSLVGKRLIQVEGQPVESLIPLVTPLIPRDNSQGIKSLAPNFITNPSILKGLDMTVRTDTINLTLRAEDGTKETVTVSCSADFQPKPDWAIMPRNADILALKNRSKNYWFEYLPDQKAMYFQYNSIANEKDEPIDKFAKRLFQEIDDKKVEKLIVDIRWNGGGNTFLSQPLFAGIMARPKLTQNGNLYVITGRNTFSAAQNFTTDLARATNSIFVGEPTGSRPNFVGESIPYALPYSKATGTVSDLYWQRSWPMDDRMWIAPDLPASPSFKAFLAGKDLAMEAVFESMRG